MIAWIAGVPAWVLDHPFAFGALAVVAAAAYLFVFYLVLSGQDRTDRRRNSRRY